MMKKLCYILLALGFVFTFSQVHVKADLNMVNDGNIQNESVPAEVYRYVGRTNYRVTRNWYYGYSTRVEVKGSYGVGGVTVYRTYNVFYRNVSYTLQYDVYSATGTYLRRETRAINTIEEDWRLVY